MQHIQFNMSNVTFLQYINKQFLTLVSVSLPPIPILGHLLCVVRIPFMSTIELLRNLSIFIMAPRSSRHPLCVFSIISECHLFNIQMRVQSICTGYFICNLFHDRTKAYYRIRVLQIIINVIITTYLNHEKKNPNETSNKYN